jgi:sulfate permease, SulP family
VLVFDTLPGLFIGIGVSLLLLLYRASRPRVAVLGRVPGTRGQFGDVDRHAENREQPGVRVLRVEGGLFFANADQVRAEVTRHASDPEVHAIVLDAEAMPFVDVTAVGALEELARRLEADGVRLLVARDIGQVRDVMRSAGAGELAEVYPSVRDAVAAASRARKQTG